MDGNPAEQVINELFPYFEALETRSLAILQLLKDKGLTTDEQFAPYLEQAANASNVKWLAARVRVERLVASALKEQKDSGKLEESKAELVEEKKTADNSERKTTEKSQAKDTQPETEDLAEKPEEKPTKNSGENDADQSDKKSAQEVRGNSGAERSDGREKDVSAGSGGNGRAEETSDKKAK